jgi:hypothetical protein
MKIRHVLGASVLAAVAGTARAQTDLVANGGFETGAFAPEWTQFGDTSFTSVQGSIVHGGSFAGEFGPLAPGGIQQTLTASLGQQVLVDFWYQAHGGNNTFTAMLGNTTLVNLPTGSPTFWTEYTFLVTVDTANPVLQFTFTNPPDFSYLDDVHVYSAGFGACCLGDTSCVPQTSAGCVSAGGLYRGDGSACATQVCPSGACCLGNASCVVTGAGGCVSRSGVYRGDNSACAGANCTAVSYVPVPLNYNFNGMVHGPVEQGTTNRDNPNGYRSISDRGLMVDGSAGSINGAPLIDPDFMPFTLVTQAARLDIVHLGDRNLVDNGTAAWGSNANTGLQPTWLPNSDQTGPQVTDVSALHAVFTPRTSLGVLYQVSNGGGRFDALLTFTDNSSVSVSFIAPDWFGAASPPAATHASGLAAQRQLGLYTATGMMDIAAADNPLNVAEGVVNVGSLQSAGLGNFSGKTLASITFQNPFAFNTNYPNPANGAGFAIIAATLSGLASSSCYANCDNSTTVPFLNVNDFVCFQTAFAAGNSYANCDHSTAAPVLNIADFVCFQAAFAAGCSAP